MKSMNEMLEEMKRLRAEDEDVQPSTQTKGNKMSQSNDLDVGKIGRYVVMGVLLLIALIVIKGSIYSVPQTEMCYVTQFQKPINVNDGPIGAGLHFKIPLIQSVDCVQVSRSTDNVGVVSVTTKDTFTLKLKVGVTTEVPPSAVYRLLYQTGRQGSGDITENLNPNIINTLRNIIGKHDLMQIAGEDREKTLSEFQTSVSHMLNTQWGIDVKEVQVSIDSLPAEYNQRMLAAQSAQAAIVLAQRQQQQAEIDAKTKVISAEGEANQMAAQADGQRRQKEALATGDANARRLQATAEAEAIKALGNAQAEAAAKMADALGRNPALVSLEQAKRWDGKLPANMYASTPLPFMTLPAGK
jgi:regulator of protease activity HflC (stomatin/prohibitin superfamily)